ncbi:hypothetical protein SAMN05444166_6209 [Singulisphaera sp. GP187]|nr:hypothetical protein SAMN05444166_6209 [Singulisphaera sp. GP187]
MEEVIETQAGKVGGLLEARWAETRGTSARGRLCRCDLLIWFFVYFFVGDLPYSLAWPRPSLSAALEIARKSVS